MIFKPPPAIVVRRFVLVNNVGSVPSSSWVALVLVERFAGRILDIDLETALSWGRLQGEAEQAGEKLPVMDSLIAATAAAHGLVVVTRNVRDMERCKAQVINPWA